MSSSPFALAALGYAAPLAMATALPLVAVSRLELGAWGFVGAFVYAASKLITATLGDQELTERAQRKEIAQFLLALIFGPVASIAVTPVILARLGADVTPATVALGVGLCANAGWPIFVGGMVPAMRKASAQWFAAIAKALDGKQ